MKGIVFLAGVMAAFALVLAGCGGGDDDGAAETGATGAVEAQAALSKEELLAQGDAVCAEVNAAVGTVGSTSSDADAQATQVASLYGGMVERLKTLGAPSDDTAGYQEFISAAEQLAQAESDVALAAGRGEGEALSSAESAADSARAAFQSAASAYGFEQCGEAPRAPTQGSGSAPGEAPEAPSEAPGVEAAPEAGEEAAPETGGAGGGEAGSPGGGAAPGGGAGAGGGQSPGGGGSSGGIGPG